MAQEQKGFFDSLVDGAKSAGTAVVNGVGKAGSMAVEGVKSAGSVVGDVAGKAVDVGKVFAIALLRHSRARLSLTVSIQSGVSSVSDKTGSFALPTMPSLPGMSKHLSLDAIIVTALFPLHAFHTSMLPTGKGRCRHRA